MIALPSGWRRLASVGSELMQSADHDTLVSYRARIAPLRPIAAIVDAALAELPEWRTHRRSERARFVTHEGEHAFGVSCTGGWLDRDARRYIGVIAGDDTYDVVDLLAFGRDAIDDAARGLVQSAVLRLGVRRRRYFHAPLPAGWHAHATGLTAHWFPPQFPARAATVVVYPANPTNEQPQAVLDAMLATAPLHEVAPAAAIEARDGLTGMHWQLRTEAPVVHRDLVVLARGAFTYALQLDCLHAPDPDARAVFLAVARSVEPVPSPGMHVVGATTAFDHLL